MILADKTSLWYFEYLLSSLHFLQEVITLTRCGVGVSHTDTTHVEMAQMFIFRIASCHHDARIELKE